MRENTMDGRRTEPHAGHWSAERLRRRAEEAIGSPEKADRWMRKPNRALGGRRPIDLLDDEDSAREVDAVLGRIEYGLGA
jgi:putative toxin-antitoxin system antitoxin component (TIGR02293 family)